MLFCSENGASLPGDRAIELWEEELCFSLVSAGVGEAAAARAAARRTRRGVGMSVGLWIGREGEVGGVFKAGKPDSAKALLVNSSVDGVKRL